MAKCFSLSRTLPTVLVMASVCGSVFLSFSCGAPFERGGAASAGSVKEEVSYGTTVYPLLKSKCSGCHSASGQAGGTAFVLSGDLAVDLETIKGLVNTDLPSDSKLIQKGGGKTGHGGGAVLGQADVVQIEAWVAQGTADN